MSKYLYALPGGALRAVVWSVWAAVAICGPRAALAAERTVLCEEFSDVWCYGCAYAGPALSLLVDVYPDSFAFVQFHVFDDYATPWGDARFAFYDGEHTPTAVFDGIDLTEGAVPDSNQQYKIYRTNHFLPERAVPTDVTIELGAQSLGGQTYRVTAQVGIESGGTPKTLRIYMVQVLDHWPETKPYHRNGFKQAAETQDITLSAGESQVVERDFTFDAESWANQENIKIIVWAQAPLAAGPAQVYQAATRLWPLISFPGDGDGDGFPDATDNCPKRYNPDQADGDGDGVGDMCDNCLGQPNPDQMDTDEDSFGDACDNCPLLHALDQTDSDGDGYGDPCDSCPEVGAPGGVNQFGRSLGCIDPDCDVDADDFALFEQCLAGPGVTTPPPGCDPAHFARADLDGDGDVDLADSSVFSLNFTGPLVSPPIYVGVNNCSSCHPDSHANWAQTAHATAFDTLVAGGNENNELCFPCHTVGYGEPSGFVNLSTTPYLAGVQCEVCHGPGSNHLADPENAPLAVNVSSAQCGVCHQSCHGLCGENHHPQYEQWSTSAHAQALWAALFDPNFVDECLQCHSVEYRLAPEGHKPTGSEVTYSIECVACHGPHGSPYVGQLRLPPRLLCADCHTMGSVVPGQEPRQPQAETLHGVGGFKLDGTPLAGPYSMHWWGIPDECSVCHVHFEPYGGPDHPVNSGHTFWANMRACLPCHSESTATLLVAMTREEIDARLRIIVHYFTPGDPLYINPGTLPPEQLARYLVAKFNYQMAKADKAYGSHSAPYTRALLHETETFLGIPPWSPRRPGGMPTAGVMPTPRVGMTLPLTSATQTETGR
jgi:predicted CXXCH cytochrome family protein